MLCANVLLDCIQVSAHKKEIKTRDVSIGEKEKRIYELKKKNQVRLHSHFAAEYKRATRACVSPQTPLLQTSPLRYPYLTSLFGLLGAG
jgi:hypothetical protein